MVNKSMICPRCLKNLHHGVHTCTPTEFVRNLESQLAAATERAEKAEADAERYRWLRKHGNSFYNCCHYRGEDEVLDKNVDDAISANDPRHGRS